MAQPRSVRKRTPLPVILGPPPAGTVVVAHLREPREKFWGFLLSMDGAGAWVRGIDLSSFEDWARQEAQGSQEGMGLSTLFLPFLRVEKLVVDENSGGLPSLCDRFHGITGVTVHAHTGVGRKA